MVVEVGQTFNDNVCMLNINQPLCPVYECEVCGMRSTDKETIIECEDMHRQDHHQEEFQAGIL